MTGETVHIRSKINILLEHFMLGFTYTVPLDLPVILHSMWSQTPKYLNELIVSLGSK